MRAHILSARAPYTHMSYNRREARHWIGGEWVEVGAKATSINPADGSTLGTCRASLEDCMEYKQITQDLGP